MAAVKSKPGLLNFFKEVSGEVQKYFEHVPRLTAEFPLDVCLSYVFSRLETGQNMTLYCAMLKLHRADSSLAWAAIDVHHMTRSDFREKCQAVLGKPIPENVTANLEKAETVRDRVMHGKSASDEEKRNSIANALEYADALNGFIQNVAGFRPFADLRGFKGAGQALDKSTTRWILKGMGFPLK